MAICDVGWIPRAHVHFVSLEFIVTDEGELARVLDPQPPLSDLDTVIEALRELQLSTLKTHTPVPDQSPSSDVGKLGR